MNATYGAREGSYETMPFNALISWRSTLAGFFLSIMTLAGLLSLAVAFGGIGLEDGASVQNAGLFAGFAVVAATAVSIFVGSYFAVRLSKYKVDVVGCSQGLVLGSLVVLFVLWQTMSAVGSLGRAAAQATGAAAVATGSAVGAVAQGPVVKEMIEDNLGATTLKSDASTVIQGLASRLARGDQEGAKNYLAYQTGMTAEEANARIAAMRTKVDEMMVKAREGSATALKASGWSLFVLIVLSAIASVLGGLLGSQINMRGTLDAHNEIVSTKRVSMKAQDRSQDRTMDKPART